MTIKNDNGKINIDGVFNGVVQSITMDIYEYGLLFDQMKIEDAKADIIEYMEERQYCEDEQDEATQYFKKPMRVLLGDNEFLTSAAEDTLSNEEVERDDESIYRTIHHLVTNMD